MSQLIAVSVSDITELNSTLTLLILECHRMISYLELITDTKLELGESI